MRLFVTQIRFYIILPSTVQFQFIITLFPYLNYIGLNCGTWGSIPSDSDRQNIIIIIILEHLFWFYLGNFDLLSSSILIIPRYIMLIVECQECCALCFWWFEGWWGDSIRGCSFQIQQDFFIMIYWFNEDMIVILLLKRSTLSDNDFK